MKWKSIPLALLLFPFLFSACTRSPQVQGDAHRLHIFYNNDNFAYLETCGCRVSPIGGMDRRWNAMVAYPEDSRVFVDAGNALFKSMDATEYLAPQWWEQARGVIDAYNILKADAVEVGENEFALGVKKLQELQKQANFPFISSNIYWKGTNKLFLEDSVMVSRGGKKIGIFGLFNPAFKLPDELEARDPLGHARKMVSRLKGRGADFVIVLSHQGFDQDTALAKAVPGIDLIVGAHTQSLLQKPYTEGDSLVVQLSNQGQMLGMVEYDPSSSPWKRTGFTVAELNAEFNEGPKGVANPMKELVAVTNLRIQEANKRLDERIWTTRDGTPTGYQTFLACRNCHNKQAAFQESKPHGASFLTLMAKHQESNLDCVQCHSIGLDQPGGFRTLGDAFRKDGDALVKIDEIRKIAGAGFPAPGLSYRNPANAARLKADVAHWIDSLTKAGVKKSFVGVQCETCHGPRPNHPFADDSKAAKVVVNTCLHCHSREQAPDWYDDDGQVLEDRAAAALKSMTCPH
jgi:Cytochrome c554 and c-prime